MKILDKFRTVMLPRQHEETTSELATEDRITELFQAWQQGGKEGLRKAYQKEDKSNSRRFAIPSSGGGNK